ncbi:MAG: hypothetical protein ABSD61_03365 [Terracidiphilus sp.]
MAVKLAIESLENLDGDADGALLRHPALIENLAQETAVTPFHDHINAGAAIPSVNLHHVGMAKACADLRFALEAVGEDGIGFHVGMGNLESNGAAVARIGCAKDRGHAALGDGRVDAVGIHQRSRL